MKTPPRIVELRQYSLRPGQRDVLIDLFDREFVETQEAAGIGVIGQFRDLDDPDRFVWLRGFPDLPSRARALRTFYGGPVWSKHRDAANATMVDSDNVLLLRPARGASGFPPQNGEQPPPGVSRAAEGLVAATLYHFDDPVGDDFVALFGRTLGPVLVDAGARPLGSFVTESGANNFPTLPVREGEHVFVRFSLFRNVAAYDRHVAALGRSRRWREGVVKVLVLRLARPPEVLRLSPTARSLLRG